jgi:beta-galactosidase
MVHLLPHWNWAGREGEITPVYVYTNGSSVELFVNGESQGKKEKGKGQYRLKWEDVVYQPGGIKAVAYNSANVIIAEKEIKTASNPFQIDLIADRKSIQADNEDLSFITVEIKDEEGNICPTADNLVSFTIEGAGKIAAVGNGNPITHESYQDSKRKAFNGKCLLIVRSTGEGGTIKITATSSGLEEKSIEIITNSAL